MNGPEKGRRFLSGNTGSGNQYKVIRGAEMEQAQLRQSRGVLQSDRRDKRLGSPNQWLEPE